MEMKANVFLKDLCCTEEKTKNDDDEKKKTKKVEMEIF